MEFCSKLFTFHVRVERMIDNRLPKQMLRWVPTECKKNVGQGFRRIIWCCAREGIRRRDSRERGIASMNLKKRIKWINGCSNFNILVHMYVLARARTHEHTHIYIYVCTRICIYIYICIYKMRVLVQCNILYDNQERAQFCFQLGQGSPELDFSWFSSVYSGKRRNITSIRIQHFLPNPFKCINL
jgi:hypothetical protein